jgi:uncharacterized protein (DUF983 family)
MPYKIENDDGETTVRQAWPAMLRGWSRCCPACGKGKMFNGYLTVASKCANCGTELHHHRADDAPPYFTMTIVGHVVVGGMLLVEKRWHPELWIHSAIWLPLTILLSLWLLPRIKGTLIAVQWAMRMHGFGGSTPEIDSLASPASSKP